MRIRVLDVLYLVVATAAGIKCASWLASHFGTLAGMLGFVLGFIAGLAALFAFGWLVIFISELFRPPFPRCRKGKCRSFEDYKLIEEESERKESEHVRLCKCGGRYLMRGFSGFGYAEAWEILEGGSSRPYMKYVRRFGILGRWEKCPDSETEG